MPLAASKIKEDKAYEAIIGLAREVIRLHDALEIAEDRKVRDTYKLDDKQRNVQAQLLEIVCKIIRKNLDEELLNLVYWCGQHKESTNAKEKN